MWGRKACMHSVQEGFCTVSEHQNFCTVTCTCNLLTPVCSTGTPVLLLLPLLWVTSMYIFITANFTECKKAFGQQCVSPLLFAHRNHLQMLVMVKTLLAQRWSINTQGAPSSHRISYCFCISQLWLHFVKSHSFPDICSWNFPVSSPTAVPVPHM